MLARKVPLLCVIFLAGLMLSARSQAQDKASAAGNGAPSVSGLGFTADLDGTLDSKKAKLGDAVVVRSTEALKADGKVIFPKGTKFTGHVTQSSARAKGDADSVLAIQFEKAVLKNGEEMPVKLTIRAMAPPTRFEPGETPGRDPMAGVGAGATSSPMTGSRNTDTRPDAAAGNQRVGSNKASGNDGLNEGGQLTPASRGVYGMTGLRLAEDTSKEIPVSAVISSGKNVHLDAGTRMLLILR